MSTSQLQPQSVATWAETFPEHQVSQLQSTAFMKKLLAIAVSNIAYMRVFFPEDAFCNRNLEGLNLKVLKNDKSCPPAVQMVNWLKGVFDALDKKYLRMLILGVYRSSSDPNNLVEMYTFRFAYSDKTEMEIYNGDRKISSASTASQTKKATIALLRDLIVLIRSLSALPEDVRVTMKLFYYDKVTPEDYEPPGFKPAESDFICMEGNPSKFRFETVSTAFHSLKVRVVADTSDDEVMSVLSGQLMNEDVSPVCGMDVEMADSQTQQDSVMDRTTNEKPERCSQASIAADDGSSPPAEEMYSDVEDGEPQGVRCPCMANEDDGLMILCSSCHYWQHAVCFKILDVSIAPANHICSLCCESADDATDPELTGMNESEAQMICLWRRSLAACLEVSHLNNAQLAHRLGVTNDLAKCLMERLMDEGYATTKGKFTSVTKFIQKRKIKRDALVKYFSKSSTTSMEFGN